MAEEREPHNLEQLLDRVHDAEDGARVSLEDILATVGHRSFGTLILFAGLVTVAPLVGDVPGVPTIMAVIVALTAGQMLFGRRSVWLPGWVLRRSVAREKVSKAVDKAGGAARRIDALIRPRLTFLVEGAGARAIAAACLLVALVLPPMELVPFSANLAGAALTGFGLALIARDGLLAILAFAFMATGFGVVGYQLLA